MNKLNFLNRSHLTGLILPQIRKISIPEITEQADYCLDFEPLYNTLPRQLIYRDMHIGNLLFEGNRFVGYLDLI